MNLFAAEDPRPVHFVGVAGAGMSALALIARRRGVALTGCDLDPSGAADLAALGVEVWQGHDPSHLKKARAVVVTAAVPKDHAELKKAQEMGLPVVRRADALGMVVAGGQLVAVAGTHGKTTTTVMTTEALKAAGRNPTGLAGGRVAQWSGNAWLGGDALYVVEADEYDKAFLSLTPSVAVVNNVEADHLECYGTLADLEQAFAQFAGRAERVLVSGDDPGARRVAGMLDRPRWVVGTGPDADVRIESTAGGPHGSTARVRLPSSFTVTVRLQVPGAHNVRNAAMALAAVAALDAPIEPALSALAAFTGVGRRFEVLGEAGGVLVVDDYAHHPTEVAATLAAAREKYPDRRIVAVFQPHLYSRTALHGFALGQALTGADQAWVTEIYPAREKPIAGVSAQSVVDAARSAGADVVWVPDKKDLPARLAEQVRPNDLVLTLGAGDITKVGPAMLAALSAPKAKRRAR
jgi:UDP-N-acetylmuramate--alanine ligase